MKLCSWILYARLFLGIFPTCKLSIPSIHSSTVLHPSEMDFFAFDIGNIYAQSVVFDVQINDNVAQKSVVGNLGNGTSIFKL